MSIAVSTVSDEGQTRQFRSRKKLREYPELPRTILVADDEHLVASGLCASLRQIGFRTLEPASDGQAAIDQCREHQPDLALIDINMPNISGIDAARTIYSELGIPIIIFSAFSDDKFVASSNAIGVFGYLLKPVSQEQLRAGVTIAWGRFLERVQLYAEVEALNNRLQDRRYIEQAKWLLVKNQGMDEPDAMRHLQREARCNRRTIIDVAMSMLQEAGELKDE